LPLTQKEKDKEWNTILNTAHNNGFTREHIIKLKHQILTQQSKKSRDPANNKSTKVWAIFSYYGGYMRGITNIFRNSQVSIASKQGTTATSGISKLTCNTCQGVFIGETGRSTDTRYN